MLWGSPESPELKLARQNKQKMDRIERKLDQVLALELERGIPQDVDVDVDVDMNMNESIVLINEDKTAQIIHRSVKPQDPLSESFTQNRGEKLP